MKKLLSPFFLLFAIAVSAQDITVKWGPEFKKSGGLLTGFSSKMTFLGYTDKDYSILDKVGKKDMVMTFDLNHKMIKQTEVNLSYNGQDLFVDKSINLKNKRYLVLLGYSKSDRKLTNYMWELDKNNALVGSPKAIASAPYSARKVMFGLEAFFGPSFDTDLGGLMNNHDRTKIVQISSVSLLQSNKSEAITMVMMDENLNILWKKNQSFEESDNKLQISSVRVLKDGRVMLIGKINTSGSSNPKSEDYKYVVYIISETDMKEIEVKLPEGKSIFDYYFTTSPDDNLIFYGFYADNNNRDEANGLFYMPVDYNNLKLNPVTTPFSAAVLEKVNASKKKESKKKEEVPNLSLGGGFFNEDGSLIMSADQYFTEERTTYVNNAPRITTIYHYEDKFLFGLDNQGKVQFQNVIDNHVVTQFGNGGMSGYELPNNKLMLVYRKSQDMDTKHLELVDNKGNTLHEQDINYSNSEGSFMPDRFIQLNSTTFLISGVNYTKYRFGTLTVK